MKKQNTAFTLVELIVVITILAILGTIAFITLLGPGNIIFANGATGRKCLKGNIGYYNYNPGDIICLSGFKLLDRDLTLEEIVYLKSLINNEWGEGINAGSLDVNCTSSPSHYYKTNSDWFGCSILNKTTPAVEGNGLWYSHSGYFGIDCSGQNPLFEYWPGVCVK